MLPVETIGRNRASCLRCPLRGPVGDGPCACTVDGVDIIDHADAGYCAMPDAPRYGSGAKPTGWDDLPKAEYRAAAAIIAAARKQEQDRRDRGRAAWKLLHTEGVGEGPDWLAAWEKSIPCGACRQKYNALKAQRPPPFPLTAEWGFWLHDAVNADLGKPRPTFTDVAPLYGWR